MRVLDIVRGSVAQFSGGSLGTITPSVVKLEDVDTTGQAVLVSNFQVVDNEKLGIIQCFNNTNHLYAFGHDPQSSGFTVTYIVFMGKENGKDICMQGSFKSGNLVGGAVRTYNELKVSGYKKTVMVTFGNGTALTGVVTSLDIAVFDPEINAITVSIGGKALRWD